MERYKEVVMTQQVCEICGSSYNLQDHHVMPIHLGGDEDGVQVVLCGNCHARVHKMAEDLWSKNPNPEMLFDTEATFKRARPFIQAIINAHLYFESQPQSNKPRRRMIVLNIGDADWKRLHKAKVDAGFTSLRKFITAVLLNTLKP